MSLDLGYILQIIFSSRQGLGLVQMIAMKCYVEHFWHLGPLFFHKGKVICSYRMPVTQ
jgi:hypothetical protein